MHWSNDKGILASAKIRILEKTQNTMAKKRFDACIFIQPQSNKVPEKLLYKTYCSTTSELIIENLTSSAQFLV